MEKTIGIIVGLFAVFLLQPFVPYEYVISTNPWNILFSWMFHQSFRHYAYNMISFFMFGVIAEKELEKFYLPFICVAALISGFGASMFYSSFLGFSGVVYATIGYATARKPFLMIPAFGAPMPLIVASLLWVLQDSIGLVFRLENIAYSAHLAGFMLGFVVGIAHSLIHMKPSSGEVESAQFTLPGEDREDF